MAGIYDADIYCDDCTDAIKRRLAYDLWHSGISSECPDGTKVAEFDSLADLDAYLRSMDERTYDSDAYPKWCRDLEESDCPQHCAAGADCLNCIECSDGSDYGYFFGNSLTSEGENYVRETVRDALINDYIDSLAVEFWMPYYDYIDYGPEEHCVFCGKWAVLDENSACEDCVDETWS